jgi:ABC-type branched-subunit amino acid transport system substrate-binding protein
VGGAQIELKALDDGYEPDRCRANTERFLAEDVFALFGYVGTPTTLAALPLLTAAKVPLIAPLTGAMGLRVPFNRNVFHIRASYEDETALIVKHLTQLGLKKIGVFRQNDSYGQAGLDGVTKALQQRQLTPLAVGTVERNSSDVAAAVKTLVAARPDAIVLISAYGSCAAFIRAARQAGYGGTFFNVSFVGTQALSDALGRDALGVMVTQVVPSPFSTANGVVRDYLAALKAADPKLKPNYTSLEGYIAARVLVDGLNRGGRGREGLISGLEGLGSLQLGAFR